MLLASVLLLGAAEGGLEEATATAAATVTEELVKEKIGQHLQHVERQIKSLDYLLDTYYKDYNYTEEDAEEYVSNPINTYMLIKRTALEWPNAKAILFNETADREFEELQGMIKTLKENTSKDEL